MNYLVNKFTSKQLITVFSLLIGSLFVGYFFISVQPALAVSAGDLIKAPNSTAVYYVALENTKYVFPSGQVFLSWYPDFSLVQTVTAETLQSYNTVGNVVLRAGINLIQFVAINPDGSMNVDDPKVYALEPNGVKRWITTAVIAEALYGPQWETKIYGSPNTLISNYSTGASITSATYPTGSIVKETGAADVYYINASGEKQYLTATGFSANMFQNQFILTTDSLANYPTGAEITGNLPELTQVAGGTSASLAENAYYVATNGNDNNAGSLTSPFRTISKAATVAQAGDIIYIRGGTYDETVALSNSGTANNYITFTNYPNETVIVRGMTGYGFYLSNVDYIKINGLKITRGLGGGVQTIPAYIPYKSTIIAHGAGIKIFYGDHNIITNNEIYDNDIGIYSSEGGPDINNVLPSTYNQIINNTVHHNGEAGMRIKRSDYTVVDSNTVYNNGLTTNNVFSEYSPGIIYYCTINATITNNISYGNATHAIVNYAGTDEESCDASGTYMKNNIWSQTNPFPISGKIYGNNKVVFSVAFKEATDASHIYRQNTFYNGSPGSLMIGWGVNNTALIGQVVTFSNFNSLANALNSDSGVGNIEASTNPIQ